MNNYDSFREKFAKFCKEEIEPHIDEWERESYVPYELVSKMGQQGYLKVCSPLSDEGFYYKKIISEEIVKIKSMGLACLIINVINIPLYLLANHGGETKKSYVSEILEGKKIGAIAITEESGGSNLIETIKTTIVDNGSEIILNGEKQCILNIPGADYAIVLGRTSEKIGISSLSLVYVPLDSEGIKVERDSTIGLKTTSIGRIKFENCRLPSDSIVGIKGKALLYLNSALSEERLIGSLAVTSLVGNVIKETINFLYSKKLYNEPLFKIQTVRHKVADICADYEILKVFVNDVIDNYSIKNLKLSRYQSEIAMAKYLSGEYSVCITEKCMQLMGGKAFLMENSINRAYRDLLSSRMFAGTSNIMKEIISQKL